jgi:N-acetyltransferase
MIEPVTLRGRSVLLRPLAKSDAEPMRAIAAGSRETFTWAMVPQPETVDAYLAKALSQVERREALVFAICRPDGELLGSTRLFDLQRWEWAKGMDPRPGEDVLDAAEIGYTFLAPQAQRTPVNTEAKLLLLGHAFETWRCFRVTLKTDERNQPSRRAIERLGARFNGVLRAFQPAVDGRPRNTAYYTILDSEWPEVKARLTARLQAG